MCSERVSISCPTCGTRHDVTKITSYAPHSVDKPLNLYYMTWKCQMCVHGLYDDCGRTPGAGPILTTTQYSVSSV